MTSKINAIVDWHGAHQEALVSLEAMALYYNALQVASGLNNRLGSKDAAATYRDRVREVQAKVAAMRATKAPELSDLLLVSLSRVDELLPEEQKVALLNALEPQLLQSLAKRENAAAWYWAAQYLMAKGKIAEGLNYEELTAQMKEKLSLNTLVYDILYKGTLTKKEGDEKALSGVFKDEPMAVAAASDILFEFFKSQDNKFIVNEQEMKNVMSTDLVKSVLGSL